MPRVRGYHLILTTYGFWLPNDPRGSWSDFVRSWELFAFGPATRTHKRKSVARDPHDHAARLAAKQALRRPAVEFTGDQALAVARGFHDYLDRSDCIIHACSILPKHVHMVVMRHRYSVEQIANLLKGAASSALLKHGDHPFANARYRDGSLPTPWARRCWKCFLFRDADIGRAITYVENNPVKEGKRRQRWNLVTPYVG